MKICTKLNLVKTIKNVTFLASIGLFTVLIPSEVQSQNNVVINCSTFVKPGVTLKFDGALKTTNFLRIDSISSNSFRGELNVGGSGVSVAGGMVGYNIYYYVFPNNMEFKGMCYGNKTIRGMYKGSQSIITFTAL